MKKQYTAPVLHAQRQCGNHRKITNRVCEITKRLCEFSQAIALVIEWASDALDDNLDDPLLTQALEDGTYEKLEEEAAEEKARAQGT